MSYTYRNVYIRYIYREYRLHVHAYTARFRAHKTRNATRNPNRTQETIVLSLFSKFQNEKRPLFKLSNEKRPRTIVSGVRFGYRFALRWAFRVASSRERAVCIADIGSLCALYVFICINMYICEYRLHVWASYTRHSYKFGNSQNYKEAHTYRYVHVWI